MKKHIDCIVLSVNISGRNRTLQCPVPARVFRTANSDFPWMGYLVKDARDIFEVPWNKNVEWSFKQENLLFRIKLK